MSKIIDLTERRKKRLAELDDEYMGIDTGWEHLVDLTLDGHEIEIDRLKTHQTQLAMTIEDNIRDIKALQSIVSVLMLALKAKK
jgi:hypothetical protein